MVSALKLGKKHMAIQDFFSNGISQGVLGMLCFLGIAWAISENKHAIDKRAVVLGVGLQVILAVVITQFSAIRSAFIGLSKGIEALKNATAEGTQFVFGYLGGGHVPFDMSATSGGSTFIFALQALPMIIVVSALSMLLFYWRILPFIVKCSSWFLQKILGVGGALGVVAASKVLLSNMEAPLLIRPYLKNFSRCELFTVMSCGMATTAASVMALYTDILKDTISNPIAHILTASIISIPAAITISKLMIPQTGAATSGELVMPYQFTNSMDAVSKGTSDGLNIFLHIIAMLIVVLALVALTNSILSCLPLVDGQVITLSRIFGVILAPITWLMGVPWSEAMAAGQLLGTKTVLNEVIAFIDLSKTQPGVLSPRTTLIMVYALCGFANFSAMGITIGGLGTMVPERRDEIMRLGLKSILAGMLATCMSGTIMGILSALNLSMM